jgi:hypothetical protein
MSDIFDGIIKDEILCRTFALGSASKKSESLSLIKSRRLTQIHIEAEGEDEKRSATDRQSTEGRRTEREKVTSKGKFFFKSENIL